MPIAVELSFSGATLAQYDEIMSLMGLTPGGAPPPGALFHWVAETDDGLHVVDVWESREAFDAFAQESIRPFTKQVGIEDPPEITFYEVHNHLTAG